MEQPRKKQVSTILSMYEKELVQYPYFKMIFSVDEANLHVRIKPRGQWHWFLYEELVSMSMELWLTKWEAMRKARETVLNFYTACANLTKKGTLPFIAIINDIDESKVLNPNLNNHDGREQTTI